MTKSHKVIVIVVAIVIATTITLVIARPAAIASVLPSFMRRYAITSSEFHLRPSQTGSSTGPEYPAATRVEVLMPGILTRHTSRMYRVRVVSDGAIGWMFLDAQELAAGAAIAAMAA